jgi:hypothetical protein
VGKTALFVPRLRPSLVVFQAKSTNPRLNHEAGLLWYLASWAFQPSLRQRVSAKDILVGRKFPFLRGYRRLPHQEKCLCSFDMKRLQLPNMQKEIDHGSPGNYGPKTNNPTTSAP